MVLALLFLLASCGGQSGGNGAVTGTTQVTIPFASSGGTTVAGGALVAQTIATVPAAVNSMAVTAQSGTTIVATATASRPNLVVNMNLANATGVTFLVQAFDIYGSQIYEGTSGVTNLAGVPVTVGVTERVVLGGVAATGLPVANGAITVTDANGVVGSMTTDAVGGYRTVLPANLAYPLLLESTLPNGTVIASMMTRLGKVHTNTLSTLVVAKSLGVASYSQINSGFTTNVINTYTNVAVPVAQLDQDLDQAAKQLMRQLGLTAFTLLGKKDILHDPTFVANGVGLDGVMDALRLTEKDVDGDGKPDLVLTNRSAAGKPIISVRSSAPTTMIRDAYAFSIPGTVLVGDDIGGVPITDKDIITPSKTGGKPQKITLSINTVSSTISATQSAAAIHAVMGGLDAADVKNESNAQNVSNGPLISVLLDQIFFHLATMNLSGIDAESKQFENMSGSTEKQIKGFVSGGLLNPYGAANGFDPYTAAKQIVLNAGFFPLQSVGKTLINSASVKVVDVYTGQVIQGASVSVNTGSAISTDVSGLVPLGAIPSGSYRLQISHSSYVRRDFHYRFSGIHSQARVFLYPTSIGAVDSDQDGLPDVVESGTGIYLSIHDTGTSSSNGDSDGDGVLDGVEVLR